MQDSPAKEKKMKYLCIQQLTSLFAGVIMLAGGTGVSRAADSSASTVPVTMTVTASVAADKRMPEIRRDDIVVRQGKSRLKVTEWVPARGSRAGLELFILIDDAADARFSLQYDDLRTFIKSQPASTLVGVGYMRNATVQIGQELTSNHELAAQALRMPLGYPGAYGSPYLSVVDLMKKWPVDQNRREVLMITSGVGRVGGRHLMNWRAGYRLDPDVDTASAVAQRTGTNIFGIYTPGSQLYRLSQWSLMNGQMNMSQLADRTGGATFYLGLHSPVSIQPYLAALQKTFDNQYLLSFSAKTGKKAGLQTINLSTEVAGVDLAAHDSVWVAGAE
jgi:hypothetical protein